MQQITTYKYEVTQGETVTFEVTPVGTGPTVKASQNGASIPNTGTAAKPEFSFDVTNDVGQSHFVQLECSFQPGDPDTARFDIVVRCSHGDSYSGGKVKKTSPIKDPMYTFDVVA